MSNRDEERFTQERQRLADEIERQGIRDPAVMDAMRSVPREAFLPPRLHEFAYRNAPLPIGNEQTISQPFVVALMTAALELDSGDRVLEIGTGSGYAAAILGQIVQEVYTVERYRELAEKARACLEKEGYTNVHVLHGDGTEGWPEYAPYDAIIVAAGAPAAPPPLLDQLRVGGRLVIPVGRHRNVQELLRIRKRGDGDYKEESLGGVRFVPLVGTSGWNDNPMDPARTSPHSSNCSPQARATDWLSSGTVP
ncbi:MAG: protein-L-isoaspartate(D-aspartate) O-methyltransferase [Planctomycetota bacterium]